MKFTYAADARPIDGFTIRRGIHRGGFGEVYYAVSDAGKEVALKLLTHDLDTELRGIRQCLNLKHPNLVTIFDVRTDHDNDQWVVMEYVNGSNLEEVLTAFPNGLPLSEVRDWLQGMVAGVEYLHDRGLIHRDLKPANIYRENGVVKVGDVGLSKRLDGNRRNQHTESIGTVYYMAPEITHGKYGPQVDVYSLGIVLYEMLTGKLPFSGETSGEILMKQLSAAPDLSVIPHNLRPVLARALEKDPEQRTPSARQLWNEFEQAVSGPTAIPETHFVNGSRPAMTSWRKTAAKDTDRSRDTNRRQQYSQPPTSPSPQPRPLQKTRHGFETLLLISLAAIVLIIPWSTMTWRDCGAAAGIILVCGGFLALLVRLREQRRIDVADVSAVSARSKPDWAGSMVIAALTGGIFSLGALLIPSIYDPRWAPMPRPELFVFFTTVAVLGAWTAMAFRWLTQHYQWGARHPRLWYAAGGLVLATVAYHLDQFLMIDISLDHRHWDRAMFDHLGVNPLVMSMQPTWLGYVAFFGGLFFWTGKRFRRMQDADRPDRWMFRHILAAAAVAWLWVHLLAFPQMFGLLWAATIVSAVQIAAPWQSARALRTRD